MGNELAEHKRNAPPSKGLQHQNYIEKDMYLQYEVNKAHKQNELKQEKTIDKFFFPFSIAAVAAVLHS